LLVDYVSRKKTQSSSAEVQPDEGDLGRRASSAKSGWPMVPTVLADSADSGSPRTIFINHGDTEAMLEKPLILESTHVFPSMNQNAAKNRLSDAWCFLIQ